MLALLSRFFYLQIEKQGVLNSMGERNFLRMEVIVPLSGDVYDRRHTLQAANRPVYDISWHNLVCRRFTAEDPGLQQIAERSDWY